MSTSHSQAEEIITALKKIAEHQDVATALHDVAHAIRELAAALRASRVRQ